MGCHFLLQGIFPTQGLNLCLLHCRQYPALQGFPCGSTLKNLPAMYEAWLRSLGQEDLLEEHGNPLQYSCLENHMDRGAWWAIAHGVAKSWIWFNWLSTYAHTKEALPFYISLNLFANILLSIFVFVLMRNVDMQFSFVLMSLSSFMSVIMGHKLS